jgi:hypothetical protein
VVRILGDGQSSNGAHDWLYPVTQGGNAAFFGPDAVSWGGLADFRRVVTSGRIVHGEGPLRSGSRSLRVGDVLWLYGGTEVGIVGRATVRKLDRPPEPRVSFALDRAASRVLALDAMPDLVVRRWLPGPIDRPIPLAQHPELLGRLRWWIEELEADDRSRLEPLGLRTLRQALRQDPSPLRSPAFGALVRMLRARQLAIGIPPSPGGVSLVGCDDHALVVASMVRVPRSAMPRKVLESVGVFAWYGRSLARNGLRGSVPSVCLVFESSPPTELVTCLEDLGTFVCWAEGDGLELAPSTRRRLEHAPETRQVSPTPGVARRLSQARRPTARLDGERVPDGSTAASGVRGRWLAAVADPVSANGSSPTDRDQARDGAARGNGAQRPQVEPGAPSATRDPAQPASVVPTFKTAQPPPTVSLKGCTALVSEALQRATETASSRHHGTVETAHVIAALMDAPGEGLARMLDLLNVTRARVRPVFEDYLARLPAVRTGPVTLGSDLEATLRNARLEAAQIGERGIDAQLFFVGALRANSSAAHELGRCGVHLAQARTALVRRVRPRRPHPRRGSGQWPRPWPLPPRS